MRTTWIGNAMSTEAAEELLELARARYGYDKARLAVLVRPAAIEKVVDNAKDASESIRRLKTAGELSADSALERKGEPTTTSETQIDENPADTARVKEG